MGNVLTSTGSSGTGGHLDPTSITGDPNDPEYWRRKGDAHAQARNAAFAASQAAYRARDGARAKHLSIEGKSHAAKSAEAHARAAALLLALNNAGRPASELDLHGLRVAEAVDAADGALRRARSVGLPKMVLIVGKGLHSAGGVSRLRPAIEELVRRHNVRATPGVPNEGCITVEFVSEAERGWVGWLFGAGCVIC